MRDVYALPEHQTGRPIPGGKRIRTQLRLNWKFSSIDPRSLDTLYFMEQTDRTIHWKGSPDKTPMGRVLAIDAEGWIEVIAYYECVIDGVLEPATAGGVLCGVCVSAGSYR